LMVKIIRLVKMIALIQIQHQRDKNSNRHYLIISLKEWNFQLNSILPKAKRQKKNYCKSFFFSIEIFSSVTLTPAQTQSRMQSQKNSDYLQSARSVVAFIEPKIYSIEDMLEQSKKSFPKAEFVIAEQLVKYTPVLNFYECPRIFNQKPNSNRV
jgi:hypothetical protein